MVRIWEYRYPSVIHGLLRDPRRLVSCVHSHKCHFRESACYLIIKRIPRHTVVYTSRRYLYTQNKPLSVTCRMRFIRKLPLVLSLYKHPAFRVCCRYALFCCPSRHIVIAVVFFYGLLPQLLPFRIHFFPQLLGVDLGCFGHLLFLVFLFVCVGFDMRSVYEDHARVYHPVVQRLVQDMREYLLRQLCRKPLAEGIAHRCKVRDLFHQSVSQKPPI